MGAHPVDLVGGDAGVVERDRGRPSRLGAVGPRLDHVERIRRRPVSDDLRVRLGAARPGDVLGLEDQERRALAHDEAVARRVERPARLRRVVVLAVGERPDDVERAEGERAQGDLRAAGDRGIDLARRGSR